ncbi:MAG: lysoplasmalogenase family protein [Polyangiales bacterium]
MTSSPHAARAAPLDAASRGVVALAALFALAALGCDLARLGETHGALTSASLGFAFARSVTCAALVPLGLGHAAPRDGRRMLAIFALVVVADLLILVCGQLVAGIAVFLVVQVGLAARHFGGLPAAPQAARRTVTRRALAVSATWLVVMGAIARPVSQVGLLAPVAVYSLALATSLTAGLSAPALGRFDRRAASRIAWGMVLFVLCDITVALNAALAGQRLGALVGATTGIFYTPSLVLLALSMRRETTA